MTSPDKMTIHKSLSEPDEPEGGWVVEYQGHIFVTPSFDDACDFVRQYIGSGSPEVERCRACGAELIFCIEPITGIAGYAVCGSHEHSVDAFYCNDDMTTGNFHLPLIYK